MLIHGDCLEALKKLPGESVDALVTDPPAGISFMGKAWDHHKGGRNEWIAWMTGVMAECLRVMKPGAHGLVWALPRTSHWTATALEDAGFEVRDVVTHLFGSGFPKSLDVSKAIDKAAGAEREAIGDYKATGTARRKGGIGAETAGALGGYEAVNDKIFITAPATDAAKKWSGFGTALKPASEHWILVRKPCSEKTVAANVLRWGTGAINVDASRIDGVKGVPASLSTRGNLGFGTGGNMERKSIQNGRFPANLILSCTPHCTEETHDLECAIQELDRQSGVAPAAKSKIGASPRKNVGHKLSASSADRSNAIVNYESDGTSGASRFFYCAKASRSDKGKENTHPTVKSTKLMQYLIRMVTPSGGTVLDPFTGSGSTGVAAKALGYAFLGIEQDADYVEIAKARIDGA